MRPSNDEWGHFEKVVIGNAVVLQFWDNHEQVIGQIRWSKIASQIPRDFRLTKDKMPEIITILTNCNSKDKTEIKQAIADALEVSVKIMEQAIRRYYKKLYAEMNDKKNESMDHVDITLDWGSLDNDNPYYLIKEYIAQIKTIPRQLRDKGIPQRLFEYIGKLWEKDEMCKDYYSLKVLFDHAETEYNKAYGQNYQRNILA